MCRKYCSKMTAHSQHGIISFCSERNNPACEITRNAIIIELDIKSKTKFFTSTAYLLSSASPMSAPCLFVATYWTLVKDSELKKKKKLKITRCKDFQKEKNSSFALQQLLTKPSTSRRFYLTSLNPQFWDFSCSGHKKHLFRAAEQAAPFLP